MKTQKSILEQLLLAVCLSVLALRATNSEAINISAISSWANIGDDLTSLIFTSILFVCVLLWFIRAFFNKTFIYSFTAIELPLLLFLIAGVIGIAVASHKRAAVNDFVTMVAPFLAAIMLVQILDSDSKIRFVLAVIIALACASAYRCLGQFFTETQMMVEQYEADPESMLRALGLTAGSSETWLFEHRLYTKGVNGFLTTSNSVASFAILAVFAAVGLFAEQIKRLIKKKGKWSPVIMTGVAVVAVLLNFLFVRSKGGTAALILALILFAALICFGSFISRHRQKLLVLVLLCILACVWVVINYGLEHGRLPGGNSMLVRWQYWTGAAQMYDDHKLTGVGPGNFNSYYPQYKAPAAFETVKNPHNFILSILTQYGPLGLIAFLALLFVPLWRVLKPTAKTELGTAEISPLNLRAVIIFVIAIAVALLIVRPILNPIKTNGESALVIAYVVFTLYVTPVIVFVLSFALVWAIGHRYPFRLTDITSKALLCGCVGLCVHNLLDFAIFEPCIYTTLWVTLACLIALNRLKRDYQPSAYRILSPVKIIALAITAVVAWAFFHYAVLPVGRSTFLLYQAHDDYSAGLLDNTQVLLKKAAKEDTLNPHANLASGTLYLQYLDYYGPKQKEILALAEEALLAAAERDRADFKPYEKLTAVYKLLADKSAAGAKSDYLHKSFDAASLAVKLYPGLGRLRINLAQIAEELGNTDVALEQYTKAVEIEDAYRAQFKTMYPDRELFSRLGYEKYDQAKKHITEFQP